MVTQKDDLAPSEIAYFSFHIEANIVWQETHFNSGLSAIELIAGTVYIVVYIKGINVTVSAEAGSVIVIQCYFGIGWLHCEEG